jgi:hypothetical protein
MEQRQLSVSIIQAINRILCRQVVDAEGRCPSADIFIVLPRVETGDAILEDIKADMPDLNVVDWKFDLNGPRCERIERGMVHEALNTLMDNRLTGETPISFIRRELAQ